MKRIERPIYLSRLISSMNRRLVKIITGIRRCGKSYLLFGIFRDYLLSQGVKESQIISISLESEKQSHLRDPGALSEYIESRLSKDEMNYIFIDEAQMAISKEEALGEKPLRLYGVLNELLKEGNVDVYITGSNSKFLSSDIRTEFRGRREEIRVAPLSFSEFMEAYGGDRHEGFAEYLAHGGMPLVLEMDGAAEKERYLRDLFENTYFLDIKERYGLKADRILDALTEILASSVGSLTNPKKLVNAFESHGYKTNDNTIGKYIEHLKDAFLLSEAKRYDIKGKKYINTIEKYYFADPGLRNACLNFRQPEPGHLMENVVYNELIYRGYNVDVGVVEGRKREGGKSVSVTREIDFVCSQGSKRIYIQSAYSIWGEEKMKQELASLKSTGDSFLKIVLTADPIKPWYDEQGNLFMNVIDFLLDPDSIARA